MALTLQIKRSTGSTAPGTLADGELAYTHGNEKLYIGDGSTVKVLGGKSFNDKIDHTDGTLTASSAVLVDSNKAIDEFIIGNNATTGGALKIKEGTNNGTHHVQLKAPNSLSGNVEFTLPSADGSADQFLKTNGSGTLSFGTISSSFTLAADSGSDDTFNTSETLTFTGGDGIDTTVSNNTITIAGEKATTSNKGIASFSSNDFAVSGQAAVTIKSGGVSNTQLENSSITIGSSAVSLGGTVTDINGVQQLDVDHVRLDGNTISTTNSNGNLVLEPNGTGSITVPSGYESRAGFGNDSLVNKSYVDAVANGLDVKKSVRVATTGNLAGSYNNGNGTITASSNGAISIDGVSLSVDDRVLVKDQTSQVENGFYKVTTVGSGSAAFVLTRTPDGDEADELTGGAFTFVEEGTANADNGYVASHNGTPTVGTTNITFEQFSGAGQIAAGAGLTKTGNTIDVVGTANKITVSANALTIASTYVGQSSITTLGTISTGTWNGTTIGTAYGGTGLTSIAKGSVLVANSANTLSALDGGGNDDGVLFYTASSDTLSFATSIDGGTF
jgi:hypothetical protein